MPRRLDILSCLLTLKWVCGCCPGLCSACRAGLWRLICGGGDRGSTDDVKGAGPQKSSLPDTKAALSSCSAAVLQRHLEEDMATGWPALHFYDVSADPPPAHGEADRAQPRRAFRSKVNDSKTLRVENSCFVGEILLMHRTRAESSVPSPYEWYFRDKKRRWEFRLQGRFKWKPTGKMFVGVVLEDFDYSKPQTWNAQAIMVALVPLLEASTGERFHFSWGSRGEAAQGPDAHFATVVGGVSCFDQLIVTPPGEQPPEITGDISDFGLRRNAMSSEAFRTETSAISDSITTEAVYTFCVWGPSQLIDISNSCFDILGTSWSYGSLLDEWPAHLALYAVEEDGDDPNHLEQRKTYIFDSMVWTSDIPVPGLPRRYDFNDQR